MAQDGGGESQGTDASTNGGRTQRQYLTSFTSGADAQASVAGIASFGGFQQRRAQSGGLSRSGERRVVQIYLSPAADISCRTEGQAKEVEVSL